MKKMIFKNFPGRIKKNSQEVKYEAFSLFALPFQGTSPFIKKKFFSLPNLTVVEMFKDI